MRSFPERAVRVRALAGDIVLCSWARHFTLTVPLSTGDLLGKPNKLWGLVTCDGLASRPGGVEILLAASCYGNRDKLLQYEPVWLIRLHYTLGCKISLKLVQRALSYLCQCLYIQWYIEKLIEELCGSRIFSI